MKHDKINRGAYSVYLTQYRQKMDKPWMNGFFLSRGHEILTRGNDIANCRVTKLKVKGQSKYMI